ncbi:uncharacterized protein LOC108436210 [Pygocentrus nattereri]|uniref:ZP domain-containing protein n=1 Tax=Pygocentrus nattereri TaxID=42514 RepID=A0AAR2KE24_PYGNA|nr:uncharacterized protein LOC108436210 [Pygocentrus nattereri]
MSWKKHKPFLLMAAATLSSVVFCLATGPREPDKVIRYGALVVGDHYKGILNETVVDLETKLRGEAAEDSEGYQADQPEATVNQLAELKLQRLRPSVRCGNDSMTLHLLGWSVPDFLVETGEENPVPLSEMPAHCGFSVKRARGDVFLVAKYDGCPITQQGDSYILSLRLWDTPVRMSCSVASPLKVSCLPSAMVIELGVSVDAIKLKANREWQPLVQACSTCGFTLEAVSSGWIITAPYMSNCFQIEGAHRLLSVLYMYGELTLSCPVVQAPAMTLLPADEFLPVPPAPQAPVDHPFPHDYADAHDHPRSPIVAPKSTAPTSTASSTPTKASAREQLWYAYPYDYARPWPFYHSPPRAPPNSPTVAPKSTAPTSTASATASSTPTKASAREQLWYAYPYDYARPWPFYHSPPRAPPNSPTVAPKSTGSTTMSVPTKAGADQPTKSPKVSPETTAPTIGLKVKPPSDDQQLSYRFPWLPGVYDPLVPNSQSLPVSAPVSLPWILYPRRHSKKDQKHSVPVDAASAGSQSAPFTRNRDDLQPVYPRQKWYYPMYQVPYASQHKPASSVVSPSTTIRREEHGVPQLYSLRYDPLAFSPPMQSSRDSGMYPLISRPAHDHVSASRWWKSVSHPAQLSPLLVKAWLTNKVS